MELSVNDKTKNTDDSMKILEDALVLCRFGKFHIRLLAASLCAAFAVMMVTTTSSYILPVAECDLNMNIMYKGLLNAMPFFGQIGASLFTGFLIDAFGRKIFLVGGNAAIFVCTLIEGSSQNYWMLIFMKLLEGISMSLSFSAISTNLTEFCHKDIRDRTLMLHSGFMSLSLIVAALVSWAILPLKIDIVFVKGYFELHAWNIYLYVCSIWSFMGTILFYNLPESPKYLLSHGQEKEALEVVRIIYSENTGNAKDTFPVTSFNVSCNSNPSNEMSLRRQLVNALYEVKELFRKPLVFHLLLFSMISFIAFLGFTSLRLWYPQLSTIVENFEKQNGETARFCVMLTDYMQNLKVKHRNTTLLELTEPDVCVPKLSGSETYINGMILGFVSLIFVAITCYLVKYVSQKVLMFIFLITCSMTSAAMYWTSTSIQIALLVSCTCAFIQTAFSLQQNLFVRVFPTTLRALAFSIIMVLGRLGSVVGNIIFPILLETGCMAPFILTSTITLCISGVVYFLPGVNKENKEVGDK
ncbi:synaptic vesicle glycoprotein 2B-like [Danaus plexippus]|uniref:synaptic vesicle glycoprotein 2B-like n=1 Tax=Danaus plexippus TaxID=13037 RepID=UPI002AB1BAEB|nr:synaptic vesicle glycoprotein 2B-like [Danaus plexippus]